MYPCMKIHSSKIYLNDIIFRFGKVQKVLSLSSGSCIYVGGKGYFGKVLYNIEHKFVKVNFRPFTEKEFNNYIRLKPNMYTLEAEVYKRLTSYSPKLLKAVEGDNMEEAIKSVRKVMKRFVADIRMTLNQERYNWISEEFPKSIEILCYAENGTKINREYMIAYCDTWACAENLTYVSEENAEFFKLTMTFPMCFQELIRMLHLYKKEFKVVHSTVIDGLYFEHEVCGSICELNVLYSKKDEAITLQSDLSAITFCFDCHLRQQFNSPLKGLVKGVLYHLRDFHPVIDAVSYVDVGNTPWLLLIQVSFKTYQGHDKTFTMLLQDVKEGETQQLGLIIIVI